MVVIARRFTADELLKLPSDDARHELVRGELRKLSFLGGQQGVLVATIASVVADFARRKAMGRVFGASTGFWIERNPDTVVAPNVSYVRTSRLLENGITTGFVPFAPDLVAEVTSPMNLRREVEERIAMWLASGVTVAWLVDPDTRTILVQRAVGPTETLGLGDTLTEPGLLPGFAALVADVFDLS